MTVTVYSNSCLPCTHKALWKQLRSKAAEKRVLLKRVDIRKDAEARDKATNLYGMSVPFIVDENGTAMTVDDFLHE